MDNIKLNVGIIGAGKFSHRHIRAFRSSGRFEVVAASRRDNQELAAFCREYGLRAYTDYHELLMDREVNVVLVSTPHHLHYPICCEAAQKGKHIMVEKPMALTANQCQEMNRIAEENGVTLMIGHTARFTNAFISASKYLAEDNLGDLLQVNSVSNTRWVNEDRKEWHLMKKYGGGYLYTLGIHQLDLIMQIVNAPAYSVRAKLGTFFHDQEVDDHGMIWINFSNGVLATLVMTGFRSGVNNVSTEITGRMGQIKFNSAEGAFYTEHNQWVSIPDSAISGQWIDDALLRQWEEFAMAISESRLPSVNGWQIE
ncbi:MAG: Gfo/Idh/MocA family oxidoreductase, partial [Saprospiraceae bacterium]|nr:Gfo/Idh/MocA family oxidoreductase [Saprospiraceae bacterium]